MSTLFDDDYWPLWQARSTDPDTSVRAAGRLKPGADKARLLAAYSGGGLTDEQAAGLCKMSLYRASKRCADLRRDGFIVRVGVRPGLSGADRMVCALTVLGRETLKGLRL
jgi:hypothetical protein